MLLIARASFPVLGCAAAVFSLAAAAAAAAAAAQSPVFSLVCRLHSENTLGALRASWTIEAAALLALAVRPSVRPANIATVILRLTC